MKLNSPKIYKNRKAKNHPSIQIMSDEKTWKNMVMTHSPAKKKRYIVLKTNPNPKDPKKSYVEKRVRNDSITTRGEEFKKYKVSNEDVSLLNTFLNNKKS